MEGVLQPLCAVQSSIELYRRAVGIHARWRVSLHDPLVVAAALEASCDALYSEDLQSGRTIETLTVVDPFLDDRQVHDTPAA